jgi:excisionase family DNA binding protein
MGIVEDKRRWFEQVLALRRAERAAPDVREIPEVRAQIERQIGSALSVSSAARVLDVSETTLRRWIQRGELPLVITEHGRRGIPVRALADLYEQVAEQRARGRKHVIEPGVAASREAARRMRVDARAVDDPHRRNQARALAYHRAVARKLTRAMADDALHRVWEWQSAGRIDPEYATRWEQLLRSPIATIKARIGADDPEGDDLRQSSPFAGMLSEAERRRIFTEVR